MTRRLRLYQTRFQNMMQPRVVQEPRFSVLIGAREISGRLELQSTFFGVKYFFVQKFSTYIFEEQIFSRNEYFRETFLRFFLSRNIRFSQQP